MSDVAETSIISWEIRQVGVEATESVLRGAQGAPWVETVFISMAIFFKFYVHCLMTIVEGTISKGRGGSNGSSQPYHAWCFARSWMNGRRNTTNEHRLGSGIYLKVLGLNFYSKAGQLDVQLLSRKLWGLPGTPAKLPGEELHPLTESTRTSARGMMSV